MSSTINIADPEEFEICPYDPLHRVQSRRMVYHLEKCRKNHPNCKKKTCPFNGKHRIPEPEFRFHLLMCGDKAMIDQDLKYSQMRRDDEEEIPTGNLNVPGCDFRPKSEENWEAESDSRKFFRLGGRKSNSSNHIVSEHTSELRLPVYKPNVTKQSMPVYEFSSSHLMATGKGVGRGRGKAPATKSAGQIGRGRGLVGLGKGENASRVSKKSDVPALEATKLSVSVDTVHPDQAWPHAAGCNSKMNSDTSFLAPDEFIDSPQDLPDSVEDTTKTIRRLEKKLRQINNLEEKKSTGKTLDNDEMTKLAKKDHLSKQLAALKLRDS